MKIGYLLLNKNTTLNRRVPAAHRAILSECSVNFISKLEIHLHPHETIKEILYREIVQDFIRAVSCANSVVFYSESHFPAQNQYSVFTDRNGKGWFCASCLFKQR